MSHQRLFGPSLEGRDSPASPAGDRLATPAAPVVVIGAGPAGLTAALELARRGVPVLVLEADQRVGGLAQTVEYKGYRFDIGGHRFFTKVREVRELWRSLLGPDFLQRPRLSRILYDHRFFNYPLKPLNALLNLGVRRSLGILLSYVQVKIWPIRPETSFEAWVSNRFGRRLYRTFFETYTEKVWGMSGRDISARWAAQRIKGFSLGTAIIHMLAPWLSRRPGREVKTLIDEFEYPRLGPGMMWEACAAEIERAGGRIVLNARATALHHDGRRVTAVTIDRDGAQCRQPVSSVISSMPLKHLVECLEPSLPADVRRAASGLKYRDFLTVALIVDQRDVFPDNWLYIHDAEVNVGRIQNFKNWSPDMVPDASKTCLGLEYFCGAGDGIQLLTDEQLIALATTELGQLGLVDPARVEDGAVVHAPKAYPIYDDSYLQAVRDIRDCLEQFDNLQPIGRNGTHTYNNQDHSMVMGMLAVRNLFGERHDLWAVTSTEDYLEEAREDTSARQWAGLASTQPRIPLSLRTRADRDAAVSATQ